MKSTIEILDTRFRLAMKDGRIDPKKKHDILDLTPQQKSNRIAYMQAVGKNVTEEEIELCFKSFRKHYWKKHILPPRTTEK